MSRLRNQSEYPAQQIVQKILPASAAAIHLPMRHLPVCHFYRLLVDIFKVLDHRLCKGKAWQKEVGSQKYEEKLKLLFTSVFNNIQVVVSVINGEIT